MVRVNGICTWTVHCYLFLVRFKPCFLFPMNVILFQSLGRRGRINSTCQHSISLRLLAFSCLYKQPLHISLPIKSFLTNLPSYFFYQKHHGQIQHVFELRNLQYGAKLCRLAAGMARHCHSWWDMGLCPTGGTDPPPVLLYGLPSPSGAIGGGKAGSSPPARANHQTRYSVCRE